MDNLYLQPAPQRDADGKPLRDASGAPLFVKVPDPATMAPLKGAGEWKPATQYWRRRLRDADVVEAEPPKDAPAAAAPAAAEQASSKTPLPQAGAPAVEQLAASLAAGRGKQAS